MNNIGQLFYRFENEYAERIVFQWVDEQEEKVQSVTYRRFAEDIRRCVATLHSRLGALEGMHIALLAQNSYWYVVYFFAILLADGVAIPLNNQKDKQEILYELELSDAKAVVQDGDYFEREGELGDRYSGTVLTVERGFSCCPVEELPQLNPEKLALILFTSGTTGQSKGVMLNQKAIFNVIENDMLLSDHAQRGIGKKPKDHIYELLVLPLYHVAAINRIFVRAAGGNTINLCDGLKNFYRDVKMMPTYYMLMVPAILKTLYRDVVNGKKERLGELNTLVSAGAMMDAETMENLTQNGYFVMNCYGMTELFSGGTRNPSQDVRYLSSIGKCDIIYDVKLVNGELCFKGNGMMMGYYKNPEATRETIDEDGWLHTGDLATIDEDGYVYLTGRKKNLIILSSGENVSPEELENLILQEKTALEVVVREESGKIAAEVYCSEENREKVRMHIQAVNSREAFYKHIGIIEFRNEPFPRTGSGKIKR